METLVHAILAFTSLHPGWVLLVMFTVSFGESLAFINLLFPGTAVLAAAAALVPSGKLSLWSILAGAVAGAILGDGVSYAIGRRFGRDIERLWPFSRRPDLLARGVAFIARHGGKSVFIGRFFGPLRAVVPLTAGILRMRPSWFWFANIASALVWAPIVLSSGALLGEIVGRIGIYEAIASVAVLVLLLLGVGGLWCVWRRVRGS